MAIMYTIKSTIMKYSAIIKTMAVLLSFSSCSTEVEISNPTTLHQINVSAKDFKIAASSRTSFNITEKGAEFSWASNDTIGIFPNEGAQAYFPMVSGAGTKTASFTGGGWALKDASSYGAYYPFIGDFYLNKNSVPVDYTGQEQTGNASTAHLSAYDYMSAAPTMPENGIANFAFNHLGALIKLDLTLQQTAILKTLILTTDSEDFIAQGKIDLMDTNATIVSTQKSKNVIVHLKNIETTEKDQTISIYLMLAPTDLSGKTLKLSVKDYNGNTQEGEINGQKFEAGMAYALYASLKQNEETDSDTYHVKTAGSLSTLIDEELKYTMTSLKLKGELNGDDIRFIREMAGRDVNGNPTLGKLIDLDMENAIIVKGGGSYYERNTTTTDNKISSYMFSGCRLRTIKLPNNIVGIEKCAFQNCSSLVSILLPEGLETIESSVFDHCSGMVSIQIPSSVISLGSFLFNYCINLSSVNIPEKITTIENAIFQGCSSLTSVVIPNNVKVIKEFAFSNTKIASIILPDGLISLGKYSFQGNELISIVIPDNITMIDEGTFHNCQFLESVNIPEGVTTICSEAFSNTGIKNITLPNTITMIHATAFSNVKLESIHIKASTPPTIYSSTFEESVFSSCKLYIPKGSMDSYNSNSVWKNFTNIIEE